MISITASRRIETGWRVDDDSGDVCTIVGEFDAFPKHRFQLLVRSAESRTHAIIGTETNDGLVNSVISLNVADDFSLAPNQPSCQAYLVAFEMALRDPEIPMLLTSSRTAVLMSLTNAHAIDARDLDECPQHSFELDHNTTVVQTPRTTGLSCGHWGTYTVSSSTRICLSSVDAVLADNICECIAELVTNLELLIP